MLCIKCGKEVQPEDRYCKFCGSPNQNKIKNDNSKKIEVERPKKQQQKQAWSYMAIIGFLFTLVAPTNLGSEGFLSIEILGLILCIIALIRIKKNNHRGKLFAFFGIIVFVIKILIITVAITALESIRG